jgi:hypothetical protein
MAKEHASEFGILNSEFRLHFLSSLSGPIVLLQLRRLPTIYHWSRVAEQRFSGTVVPRSNFGGRAVMKAGASGATNRFGAWAWPAT